MRTPASISLDLRRNLVTRDVIDEAADCIDTLAARADKAETALRDAHEFLSCVADRSHGQYVADAIRTIRAALGEDAS